MGAIFLGLDCGGSSSRAVAVNAEGVVLHSGQSGSANIASTPHFRLRQNLSQALRGCPAPTYVCGCFAGLLTPEDRDRANELVRELFPDACIHSEPDFAAAFFASEPGTDICVIAGTGSLVCSWDGKRMVKSGGRGYLLGDYGSSFQYGRDALVAYLDSPSSASTALRKTIESLFGSLDEPRIISRLYHAPSPQALLGKLAKPLAADARSGAEYALASVDRNIKRLAEIIRAHAARHLQGKTEVNLSLAGGLWKTGTVFIEAMQLELEDGPVSYKLERIKTPPVYGAVRLAQEMAHGN